MDTPDKETHVSATRKKNIEMLQTLLAYQQAVNEAAIVSITDLNGNIVYVNQKFVEISKYSNEELVGKNHRLINSGYHSKEFFSEMWQSIRVGKSWRGEIKNKAKDGSFYWVDTVITPIADKQGNIFQYLSIRNLITRQKENEERLLNVQSDLIKREKQLNDAQKVAKTGSWHMSFPGENRLEWSDETYQIFEIAPGTEMTYEKFLEAIHPDDRFTVNKLWQQALKSGSYHLEHRIITKSGEKWVSERAHFEFDTTSNLKNALGTVQDITEKRKIEHSLLESKNLYKTIFNNSPFAIGIIDKKTLQFLEVNETAVRLYGYSREEFLSLSIYDIHAGKTVVQFPMEYCKSDKSIIRNKKKDGTIIYVEPSVTSIAYKGNDVYFVTINDITVNWKIEEELNLAKQMRQKDIIEAEERSRSQIGMELHDNINQLLAASRMYLTLVAPTSEKNNELIKKSTDILKTANEEIRKLSAALVTPALNANNLKESIKRLSDNFEMLNTKCELNISINEESIGYDFTTNIYRIIQEQFNNIIKYADATIVRVKLLQHPEYVELEIADNGNGFDTKQIKKGIGLANIVYRAEAYGGKVNIDTGINKGCRIDIRFEIDSTK